MTTEGGRPIDGAISPVPADFCPGGLERLRKESGLTWPGLAARMAVADRGAILLRRVERFQPGPGQRGIVALVRTLTDGGDLNGNRDTDGRGG